jgi:excisionase family DNA binding protein
MSDEKFKTELNDESLRVKDAAAILKVSPRTVWRMIADGQLTASRFRRCTRVSLAQVLSYLKGGGKAGV